MFNPFDLFHVDPTEFQKENEAMCNNDEYAHLDESALRSIHDEELLVMREKTLTIEHPEAPISPWVKRNLDGAQYAQPRGSEYEG